MKTSEDHAAKPGFNAANTAADERANAANRAADDALNAANTPLQGADEADGVMMPRSAIA